jgi:hypothetical protein
MQNTMKQPEQARDEEKSEQNNDSQMQTWISTFSL